MRLGEGEVAVGPGRLYFPPCVFGGGFYLADINDIWETFYSGFLPATVRDESEIQNKEK